MADDSQEVADIIDGLGDAPAPLEVYNATRDYDTRYLASAGAAAAAAGGSGGSQPGAVRIIGPVAIAYNTPNLDIMGAGTGFDLIDLAEGDVLHDVRLIRTGVGWHDSNGNATSFALGFRFGDVTLASLGTNYMAVESDIVQDDVSGDMVVPGAGVNRSLAGIAPNTGAGVDDSAVLRALNPDTLQATIEYDTGSGPVVLDAGAAQLFLYVSTPAAAGGGSQPSLRWRNVATITYAEILDKGSDPCFFDLLTLPTGSVFDCFFPNLTEAFDDSGGIDLVIGWLLDTGSPRSWLGGGGSGQILPIGAPYGNDWAGAIGVVEQGTPGPLNLNSLTTGLGGYGPLVLDAATAGPLQVSFRSIVGDGTGGSFDLWLRVQDPAA